MIFNIFFEFFLLLRSEMKNKAWDRRTISNHLYFFEFFAKPGKKSLKYRCMSDALCQSDIYFRCLPRRSKEIAYHFYYLSNVIFCCGNKSVRLGSPSDFAHLSLFVESLCAHSVNSGGFRVIWDYVCDL